MADEQVVDEGVSRFGLFRLHVVASGKGVDVERWVAEKAGGWDCVATWFVYREEDLGLEHLRLYWRKL